MPELSVYFLEGSLPAELPGVSPRTPGAPFPFWGTYTLFDFAFAALRGISRESCSLVCDTRDRQAVLQATSRWGRNVLRMRDAENGLDELRRVAASDRARTIVLSSLSYAASIDPRALEAALEGPIPRRVRVDSSPMPIYLVAREALLEALEQAARRGQEEGGSLRGFLNVYLPSIVREHVEVEGRIFFLDSAMQIWDAHHYLRENLGTGGASRYIEALAGAQQPTAEAHIDVEGSVTDSLVGSGAVVEGSVTDSVIFPGVVVKRGAELRQCVIMTGNRIGPGATVANTLILPYQQELSGEAETIGAGAEVGDTRNVMNTRNDDFPRQIARGLTLIGMNASVPPRMSVGTGCYIGPGSGNVLRGMKKLARGGERPVTAAASAALDLAPLMAYVERHRKFILSAHETPDADAIGSEYALLKGLQNLGRTVLVFNADPAPQKYTFLDTKHEIMTLIDPKQLPEDIEEYAFILLDVNDTRNIGNIATLVVPRCREMLIVDHHETDEGPSGANLISRGASSTCEIIYQFLKAAGVAITLDVAQAIFMGIVFDTGSFIYPKTTALTFEIARELVAMGVVPNFVYSKLYESNSVGSLMLQAQVGSTLELRMGNRIAVQTMRKEMIVAANARFEDADQVINNPLRSQDIRVSIFFKENLEGLMRCSMRSKGNIDVAEIAQSYGGGGHRTAAGFKCSAPIRQVEREILDRLRKYFA